MSFAVIADVFKRAVASLLVIFNCLPTAMFVKCKNKADDGVLLNAVVTADLHTDGDPVRDRNNLLREELTGLAKYCGKTDAFILAGDITNSGDEKEYIHIKAMLSCYTSSRQYIPAMGNHDSWHHSDDPDFEKASELFQKFCKSCKVKTDKNYYSVSVNGYKFICLATESLAHNQADISEEQLNWFDYELESEKSSGKPVFVICHQTIAGKNGTGGTCDGGCVGEQSVQLEQIMKKYADDGMSIIFISGHMHAMDENSFENDGSIYYLNLPSFQYDNGIGYTLKVFEERIELQAVNFLDGEEIDGYKFTIEL